MILVDKTNTVITNGDNVIGLFIIGSGNPNAGAQLINATVNVVAGVVSFAGPPTVTTYSDFQAAYAAATAAPANNHIQSTDPLFIQTCNLFTAQATMSTNGQ